ncbi:MAG: restriction endonuclease subunit S [Roseburia faecis]|nr:restriction endonuclease subunit S [Roseburia faecis]MDY6307596.1 restriction endonuclease subunit S [Oribacterium sp.]
MEKIRIGDACELLNGFAFKSENYVKEGIRIIRIANVQKGYIEDNTPAFYPADSEGLDKYMLEENDLLMSLTGNVGRVAILQKDMLPAALNQRVACLRLKTDRITKGYLFHLLNSDFFEQKCIQSSKGVAQKNMSTDWLKDFLIPVYSVEKQQEITTTLDNLRNIINKRKQELNKLDDLIKARFVEMFGDPEYNTLDWPVKKLNALCNVGSSKRIYQEEQTMDGIPFWRISDLIAKMDTGNVESSLYIPEIKYEELKKQGLVPEPGDILMTSRGTLGRCYIISPNDRFYFQDGMISWLSHYADEITPVYIQYLFDMPGFKKQIDSMQAGSTVVYLSIAMLKKLNIMLPDRERQEQFACFVDQVDKSKAAVQKSLDETQLLFDSLMQKYFG